MDNKFYLGLVAILCVFTMIFSGISLTKDNLKEDDVKSLVQDALNEYEFEFPTAEEIAENIVIPEIEMPKVENADNELLNDFLESKYSEQYSAIKDNAELVAIDELEEDDFKIVFEHLESLFEDEVDKDSIEVDIEDTEIEVLELGLEEDEDKCAQVLFDIEVEYEFEEGVRSTFEKDLSVIFDVCFEEGDFDEEQSEFVFI